MHRPDFCTISRKWKLSSLTSYFVTNQLMGNEEYRLTCTHGHFTNIDLVVFVLYKIKRVQKIETD